ncbi:MAG: elongation factor 1-beta [Thermoplasmatota archaeon]
MGEVLIRYKVMPESPEVDLEAVAGKFASYVPEHGRVSRYEIKPAFFGLKMLEWTVVLDDKKGGGEELEEKMNETEGVQSVEILEMGLL